MITASQMIKGYYKSGSFPLIQESQSDNPSSDRAKSTIKTSELKSSQIHYVIGV